MELRLWVVALYPRSMLMARFLLSLGIGTPREGPSLHAGKVPDVRVSETQKIKDMSNTIKISLQST